MSSVSDTRADPAASIIDFYESLTPCSLPELDQIYAPDARFEDPFNQIDGILGIKAVFEHMFKTLSDPRFTITGHLADAGQAFMTWRFTFRFRRFQPEREFLIQGSTHVLFDPQGRVRLHRDYWDPARELYEHLPLLGSMTRWLRRRLATPMQEP